MKKIIDLTVQVTYTVGLCDELERMVDSALAKETKESLTKWLNKRHKAKRRKRNKMK